MLSISLDEVLDRYVSLPPKDKDTAVREAYTNTKDYRWIPNPGPQTEAYLSEADVLLYGGEPGGGKSQLLLGLAFNSHKRTLLLRRKYSDIGRLVEDALKINGGREGFNGSPPPQLKTDDGRVIDFGAAHRVGDEQSWMGKGRDLLGIDEATHFAESQVRFLMGWNRTEEEGQRVRTVLATNPPLTAEGLWVIQMFAPWLDPQYPDPAKPGDLRWAISDEHGKQTWVKSSSPVTINGKSYRPKSYTYIPASVEDNPYYAKTDYARELEALPEPYRSLLLGGFRTAFKDAQNQVIPTDWIKQAQARWTPRPPDSVPMCAIGVDPAQGGDDETVLAPRFDGWFPPLIAVPGRDTPYGTDVAALVVKNRRDKAIVGIDMGGGYGGATFEHLKANDVEVRAHKGAEQSVNRTNDRQLKFTNKRSEVYWRFREALDPSQPVGSPIALPDDPKLVADLTAPTFEITSNGIKVEPKEDVCERLGRSTDRGDAIVISWSIGPTYLTDGKQWRDKAQTNHQPRIIHSQRYNRRHK
jgi:hypothetical protein